MLVFACCFLLKVGFIRLVMRRSAVRIRAVAPQPVWVPPFFYAGTPFFWELNHLPLGRLISATPIVLATLDCNRKVCSCTYLRNSRLP
jgi:hypothetical protein